MLNLPRTMSSICKAGMLHNPSEISERLNGCDFLWCDIDKIVKNVSNTILGENHLWAEWLGIFDHRLTILNQTF